MTNPNPQGTVFVVGKNVRISVVTDTCIRLESSRRGEFEDRTSVIVARRYSPAAPPQIRSARASACGTLGCGVEVETRRLRLRFMSAPPDFGLAPPSTLTIDLLPSGVRLWPQAQAAAPGQDNLLGVARLSRADVEQDLGVVSRAGFTLLDDSASLVLAESAASAGRTLDAVARLRDPAFDLDLYFLGYGSEYSLALRDLTVLTGDVPVPPRWAFGIWWHVASVDDAERVAAEFRRNCGVPVSAVVASPADEPRSFRTAEKLQCAVRCGAPKVCLTTTASRATLRPGDIGFVEVSREVPSPLEQQATVRVELTNARLAAAYRRHVIGTLLSCGCAGWWIEPEALNEDVPLPLLDVHRAKKEEEDEVVVFAPYSGLGSHRSATVVRTAPLSARWEVLRALPEFACCAGNACCFYFSPDVGGTVESAGDSELFVRWAQFAAVSPIFRLRAPGKEDAALFDERRPWMYDAEILRVVQQALQFRVSLVPYLYSMAHRSRKAAVPLVQPMYFAYPTEYHAYHTPHQFLLGSELMAAPYLLQADTFTRLSRQAVWFPPGTWFDIFDGTQYAGGRWQALYGGLDEMPLFAKAGAIIPLMPHDSTSDTLASESLDVLVFPGENAGVELYDSGSGSASCTLALHRGFEGKIAVLTIDQSSAAPKRTYTVIFRCITKPTAFEVEADSAQVASPSELEYDEETNTAVVGPIAVPAGAAVISVRLEGVSAADARESWERHTDDMLQKMLVRFNAESGLRQKVDAELRAVLALSRKGIDAAPPARALFATIAEGTAQELPSKSQIRALAEVLCSCGCVAFDSGLASERRRHVVAWNNEGIPEMTMARPTALRTSSDRSVSPSLTSSGTLAASSVSQAGATTSGQEEPPVVVPVSGYSAEVDKTQTASIFFDYGSLCRIRIGPLPQSDGSSPPAPQSMQQGLSRTESTTTFLVASLLRNVVRTTAAQAPGGLRASRGGLHPSSPTGPGQRKTPAPCTIS